MPTFRCAEPRGVVHWLAAALIAVLLVTGTAGRIGDLRIHMILGSRAGLFVVALHHQFVVKDGLLSRMGLGNSSAGMPR